MLSGGPAVIADRCEVGDRDTGAPACCEEGVERAAGRQPRAPVDETDRAVAADRGTEIWRFAIHAG